MLNLTQAGQSRYRIVMPRAADAKNRFAAQELAGYIRKITGAALPVVTDELPPSGQEICVGPVARDGLPDTSSLKNDGFIMASRGERIFLVGHNSRSNLYAAYSFLEDVLGCRFFTQSVEHIPYRPTLQVEPFEIVAVAL
ncbi:MAG: alpha-glucuronidase family glycosyl hydrolase [Christensenellaceae bacterium]